MPTPTICPSLLAADFTCLNEQIKPLLEDRFNHWHIDMADGHYCPNLGIGFSALRSLADRYPDVRMDVHLTVTNPEVHVERLCEGGAGSIALPAEIEVDWFDFGDELRSRGVQLGLSLHPDTPASEVEALIDSVDYLLVLAVLPGFGGQSFRSSTLEKIRTLRKRFDGPILVDGGLNERTLPEARSAGADWFAVGSSLFGADDTGQRARELLDITENEDERR